MIGAFCLAVWVCLAWCRLIRGNFFTALIDGRLVVSRLIRLRAGWCPSLYPSTLVLGAAVGSSPATERARPDRMRRTGARVGSRPQLAFPLS